MFLHTLGGLIMRDSIKKRLGRLEAAREPKDATWADYVIAAWSADPKKALSRLPDPKKGTLAYTVFEAYNARKKAGTLGK